MPDAHTPRPPDPTTQPELWAVWAAGFEAGQAAGRIAGRREVVAAILPAAEELAAAKASRSAPIDELRRRRATYATPALSAAEIRQRAARSWAEPPTAAVTDRGKRARSTASRPPPDYRGPARAAAPHAARLGR